MTLSLEFTGDYGVVQRNFDRLQAQFVKGPAQARVFNSAAISLGNAAETTLTFNSERYDVGGFHSTSTNTGRLTAPTAGLYAIGACVSFAANATGTRSVAIRLNGATYIAYDQHAPAPAADVTIMPIGTQYQLAAGDYVECRAYQSSGGALNVNAAANYSPEFWIVRLGPQG